MKPPAGTRWTTRAYTVGTYLTLTIFIAALFAAGTWGNP